MKVTHSVCGYCGVGCRIEVSSRDGVVQQVRGVPEAQVNHGHLCVKGRYAHGWHHAPDRLTKPLLRKGDRFHEASWDEALGFITRRLLDIKSESGASALGAFTSSRSTNEACYLLQKLFRSVIGTNNVDCCARVCHSSTALALQLVTGTGAATASFADIEKARCLVVAGANATEAHPVVGARIKQAALRGVPLVVIDPRRIELAKHAGTHLQLQPGTNVALFNGLANLLLEEGLVDHAFLAERREHLLARALEVRLRVLTQQLRRRLAGWRRVLPPGRRGEVVLGLQHVVEQVPDGPAVTRGPGVQVGDAGDLVQSPVARTSVQLEQVGCHRAGPLCRHRRTYPMGLG
jgi:predicted molibdopterin-dependent oxidoreductase YjgC